MRGVGWVIVWAGLLGALAGCKPTWFEAREPWRSEAEQQCLKSGAVKEGAGVALLQPIQGPGMCGADFPLKVAALGENAMLSFADVPRPPSAVPTYPSSSAYPPPPSSPSYPQAPVTLAPSNARADDRYAPDPQYRPDPQYSPDPMSESGGGNYSPRSRASRVAPEPDDYSPDDDVVVPNAPYPDPRNTPQRWRDAPQTATPAPSLRAAPVPLGRARIPVNATATVQPPATLACPIVSALDRWIVDSVQPAALRWFGQPVTEIRQISAYSCRGMNGQPGAHISEHAFGNALDIAAFTFGDGRKVTVKDGWHGLPEEQGFLRDVQSAACAQFTTVLAPGSNRFHYDHIHVDLMRRASGYRICNPEAMSGDEAAARAARNGRAVARREQPYERKEDPFAWRGTRGRDSGPTGSVRAPAQKKSSERSSYEPADDEDALDK